MSKRRTMTTINCSCNKPKLYQITDFVDGKVATVRNLCENCFIAHVNQSKHLDKKQKIKLQTDEQTATKFVNEAMSFVETIIKEYQPKPNKKSLCPKCGASFYDIAQTGKLGCAECWDLFYDDIKQALYTAHGFPNSPENLIHTGKIPKNHHKSTKKEENSEQRMVKLNYKLHQAIKQEDYKKAAQIRISKI